MIFLALSALNRVGSEQIRQIMVPDAKTTGIILLEFDY
jgi:hypothetical protein